MDLDFVVFVGILFWAIIFETQIQCADPTQFTSVRLVDGPNKDQGRVEIQYNGTWGTICDDEWDNVDAQIVCKMMGKAFLGAVAVSRAGYGPGKGTILMDSVRCAGNETGLESCDFDGWGVNDCQHIEDAGVICQDIQVRARLVGGSDSNQGRVEVQHNGIWGTVCDDDWDNYDAQVACKTMSRPYSGAVAISRAGYGPGNGTILMDNVACVGNETSLESCDFDGWGLSDCQHSEDAGVICQNSIVTIPVRLADGKGPSNGRVEVLYNGEWGTICGDSFGLNEAKVICQQLGYTGTQTPIAKTNAYFGPGSGRVLLRHVHCDGSEKGIQFCAHRGWGKTYCDHSEDASVICPLDTCRNDEFQCYDGRCISVDKVHDMTLDCQDGSDEDKCNYYQEKCLRRHDIYEMPRDKCRRITKNGDTCSSECKGVQGYGYVCDLKNRRQFCHQSFCDTNSSIKPWDCDLKTSTCGWTIRSNASIKSWTSQDEGRVIEIIGRNLSRTVLTSPLFGSSPFPLSIKYTVQKSASCVWSMDIPFDFGSITSPKWKIENCLSCERRILTDQKINVIIWSFGVGEYKIKITISSVIFLYHLFIDTFKVCGHKEILCDGRCVHPSIINDGINDCSKRKDEFGHSPCINTEKSCISGICIPKSFPPSLITKCSAQNRIPYQVSSNTCPSDYLCKQENIFLDPICLRKDQLCDGIPQCPHWDDEKKCPISDCPEACSCLNETYKCHPEAISSIPSQAYFIDISNHDAKVNDICSLNRISLVYLNISRCGLTDISCVVANNSFPNLKTLDASHNNITAELFISKNGEGRYIIFDGNPIRKFSFEYGAINKMSIQHSGMNKIQFRKIKEIYSIIINTDHSNDTGSELPGQSCYIQDINLSFNKIESVDILQECPSLKYVDLSSNSIKKLSFDDSNRLLELNLAWNLISILPSSLTELRSLLYLNLSNNKISEIETGAFKTLKYLKTMDLGHNRLKSIPSDTFDSLSRVEVIYLQNNEIHNVEVGLFNNLISVTFLDISNNGIMELRKNTFLNMVKLDKLNMKGNDISMYNDIYYGLSVLDELTVDTFSLCCVRPRSVTKEKCHSPKLSISSCQYLLRHGVLGISIWYLTLIILIFSAVLIHRHIKNRSLNTSRSSDMLLQITIADFLFGICMFMIGAKDVKSKGSFGLDYDKWIHSIWCDIIRFLSFLSMEATTLFSVFVSVNIYTTTTGRRIALSSLWIGSLFITVTCFVLNKFVITDSSALHHVCLMIPLLSRSNTSDTWNLLSTCFHTTCVVMVLVSEGFKLFRKKKSRPLSCNSNVMGLLVIGICIRNVFLCIKDSIQDVLSFLITCYMAMAGIQIPEILDIMTILIFPVNSIANCVIQIFGKHTSDNAFNIIEMIPRTIPCTGLHEKANRLMIVTEPRHKSTSKSSSKSTSAKGIQVRFSDASGWTYNSRNVKVVRHVIICDAPAYRSTETNSEVKVEVIDLFSGRNGETTVQYDTDASPII